MAGGYVALFADAEDGAALGCGEGEGFFGLWWEFEKLVHFEGGRTVVFAIFRLVVGLAVGDVCPFAWCRFFDGAEDVGGLGDGIEGITAAEVEDVFLRHGNDG